MLDASRPQAPRCAQIWLRSPSLRKNCGRLDYPLASATIGLPPVPRAAAFYQKTEPQHYLYWTATSIAASTVTSHTHAKPHFYLPMTKPSVVRVCYSLVVWDDRRRSDIRIHVRPMTRVAARRIQHLGPRLVSSLEQYASRPSAFCKVATSCQLNTHLALRDCVIERTHFARHRRRWIHLFKIPMVGNVRG